MLKCTWYLCTQNSFIRYFLLHSNPTDVSHEWMPFVGNFFLGTQHKGSSKCCAWITDHTHSRSNQGSDCLRGEGDFFLILHMFYVFKVKNPGRMACFRAQHHLAASDLLCLVCRILEKIWVVPVFKYEETLPKTILDFQLWWVRAVVGPLSQVAAPWVGHSLGYALLLCVALLITVAFAVGTGVCTSHFNIAEENHSTTSVKN